MQRRTSAMLTARSSQNLLPRATVFVCVLRSDRWAKRGLVHCRAAGVHAYWPMCTVNDVRPDVISKRSAPYWPGYWTRYHFWAARVRRSNGASMIHKTPSP